MLRELRVANLALVQDLVLPLERGLTMLTGETGAGKSLIAGALDLLAGGKGDKKFIRQGEDTAFVEGVFDLGESPDDLASFADVGLRIGSDGMVVLRRELKREGRGRVLINGLISSLSVFQRLGPRLLSIQSQDQQRVLSSPGYARGLVDKMLELDAELSRVAETVLKFRDLSRQLLQRTKEQEFANEQLEMWRYQWQELDTADLSLPEEETLREQLAFGRNLRGLLEGSRLGLRDLIHGESHAQGLLARTVGNLEPLARHSQKLEEIVAMVRDAEALVAEAGNDLERFTSSVNVDPAQLDKLEERQHLYSVLQKKYGRDVEKLLALRDTLAERIARQENATGDIQDLKDELELTRQDLAAAALDLRSKRVQGAAAIAARAEGLIVPLSLPDLKLQFRVTADEHPTGEVVLEGQSCRVRSTGADRIELLARTNRGEAWHPVGEVASGGEKSRIFLGLSVMAAAEGVTPLQLYDEIDAGLGMDNAVPVAHLLWQLARGGQVICITHLPTVAALADQHLRISKIVQDERTNVAVEPLRGEARVRELARLLGGEKGSGGDPKAQLAYARQLLNGAQANSF